MASVSIPAGEAVTLAEGLCYSVQVKNTGDTEVTVDGSPLGQDGSITILPVAWQSVVATSENGGTVEVTVSSLGSAEPVTTDAVSHDAPAPAQPTEPQEPVAPEPVSALAPEALAEPVSPTV